MLAHGSGGIGTRINLGKKLTDGTSTSCLMDLGGPTKKLGPFYKSNEQNDVNNPLFCEFLWVLAHGSGVWAIVVDRAIWAVRKVKQHECVIFRPNRCAI